MSLPDYLEDLTDEEKWVAACWFSMMGPGHGKLSFGTPSKIEPWARACLDSLVAKELITVETRGDKLRYVPVVDFFPLMPWALRRMHDPIGKRSMMVRDEPPVKIVLSAGPT